MPTDAWRVKNAEKLRKYRRKWYSLNSAHAKRKVVERRRVIRHTINSYKAEQGCGNCPERDPDCLVFHHVKGKKEIEIARAIVIGWSLKHIQIEMRKCTVLCANCHLKLHAKLARSEGVAPSHTVLETTSPLRHDCVF